MGADSDCSQQDFGKNHHADDLRVYFPTFYNTIEEKINTQMSLINICVLVRKLEPEMPVDRLVEQRTINKGVVRDALKQVNTLKELPTLEDYDIYLESLWVKKKYKEYIINYLLRHHYVRNLDLIFDIVSSKSEIKEASANKMLFALPNSNIKTIKAQNHKFIWIQK